MAEILSQSEIDALLTALSSGELSAEEAVQEEERSVTLYDFKHPNRFSKDQIRTLHSMHEHFARLFSTSLSAFLRTIVEVKLVSVDQLSYDEFIRSIPNPTCICTVLMKPLQGQALMELSPALSFSIIERLMGGAGHEFKRNRELTEIEQSIISKIIHRAFDCLREAWANVATLRLTLEKMETNPQLFLQLFLATEMVVLMTFEIATAESSGTMSVCIPYVVLEPVAQGLKPGSWFTPGRSQEQDSNREIFQRRLERTQMQIRVDLGTARLSVRDILNLQCGDVITLQTRHDEPVRVYIGGQFRYLASPGTYRSHRAVKLLERVLPEEL